MIVAITGERFVLFVAAFFFAPVLGIPGEILYEIFSPLWFAGKVVNELIYFFIYWLHRIECSLPVFLLHTAFSWYWVVLTYRDYLVILNSELSDNILHTVHANRHENISLRRKHLSQNS